MISSKCSSLHTKLKSGERHSDEESFVDESTKIITKGTFFFLTKDMFMSFGTIFWDVILE